MGASDSNTSQSTVSIPSGQGYPLLYYHKKLSEERRVAALDFHDQMDRLVGDSIKKMNVRGTQSIPITFNFSKCGTSKVTCNSFLPPSTEWSHLSTNLRNMGYALDLDSIHHDHSSTDRIRGGDRNGVSSEALPYHHTPMTLSRIDHTK